jgi:phage tail sheath gpL-like
MYRSLLAGMALALCASPAGAQITTYVAPPRTAAPQMIAAADSARRDSVATATMTNMKAWVDSAAGVAVPAHVGDSLVTDPGRPVTTFEDGAVAPATASALPLLVFGGMVAIGLGAVLVSRRPRPVRSRR